MQLSAPASVKGPTRLRRDPVLGQVVLGARVDALLKAGREARVYAARLIGSGTPVVLKLLRPVLRGELGCIRAFMGEQRLLDSLTHPAVPRLLAHGSFQGVPCFLVERLVGVPLSTLPHRVRLDARQIAILGFGLCAALDYLHRSGRAFIGLEAEQVLVSGGLDRIGLPDAGCTRPIASVDDVQADLVSVGRVLDLLAAAFLPEGQRPPALQAIAARCRCEDEDDRYFAMVDVCADLRALLVAARGVALPQSARARGVHVTCRAFDDEDEVTLVRAS